MTKRLPSSAVTAQCREIFRAWGMSPEHARVTAERLEYADLHGVDSRGCAARGTSTSSRSRAWCAKRG
jgi:LDH2 family malate/lactate/ureidoglycolate dehydrogenase